VSVILTAFNSEDFIRRSVSSVLEQTYGNFELIVVNDGSSDNTKDILSNEFPSVRQINKINGGPSSARNAGINNSDGEYIAFLDADDYWLPNKLKKQIDVFIENPDISIVSTNMFNVNEGQKLNIRFNPKKIYLNNQTEGLVKNYIRNAPRYSFHPPSAIMVSRKLFERYGLYNENLKAVEDSEIVLRWIMNDENIYFINDALVGYEIGNPDSLTKNIIDWSENHFQYWIDYLRNSINREDHYIFSQMVKKTLFQSCVWQVVLSGYNKHARALLFKYKPELYSIAWCRALLITLLPLKLMKNFVKIIIQGVQ